MQAVKSSLLSSRQTNILSYISKHCYATVDTAPIVARPPPPAAVPVDIAPTSIDDHLLAALRGPPIHRLSQLINQYENRAGHILDFSLPYEPSPASDRRVAFDHTTTPNGVLMVGHCVRRGDKHKITLCSGFAVQSPREEEQLILTCAHTFEEACLINYLSFHITETLVWLTAVGSDRFANPPSSKPH